jgi:serine/threonine-protein kinase
MNHDVKNLFHELAGLTPAQREQYYVQQAVPPTLQSEVESLLAHDRSSGTDLIGRVAAQAQTWLREYTTGQACGPYRLVTRLGSGGMGDVYLAERVDGELQQTVAIKFLRLDADTARMKDRFLRERQILASLRHPGIAHLLDAGHTEAGQPFLVMEHVDGIPIDRHCKDLDLTQKLQLFVQVCEAVFYAHQNLVIHRDLKPSNILVNQLGNAKLLDFGIAKIIDETMDEGPTRERIMTPEYASPEQVQGAARSTSTDIYSLGAVLYKLLTGSPPHVLAADSDESLEWVICNKEPLPASRLNPALPRDLDHILAMALRKEPGSRYQSVDALREDVRAFLESRPVRARSRNPWYRAGKFVRRFWIPVTASALTMAALAIGLLVASRERQRAERRFNDVRQLSSKLLDVDVLVRQLPGSSKARQFIVDTSLEYMRRLSEDAANSPELALELATAYMRVGRVQGVPISANLGEPAHAEENLQIAERLIDSVLARESTNSIAMLRAAQIAHDRMILAQERRPQSAALPLARKAEQWLDRFLQTSDLKTLRSQDADGLVIVGMNVANWYTHELLYADATKLLRRTIELAKATGQLRQAGAAQINVARTLRSMGDLDGALTAIREGAALLKPPAGDTSVGPTRTYSLALVTQGEIEGEDENVSLGHREAAAELFDEGYRTMLELARRDPGDSMSRSAAATRGARLAAVLRHSNPQRALEVCETVLRLSASAKANPRARRDEARIYALRAQIQLRLGRAADARRSLDEAFLRLQELKLYPAGELEMGAEPDRALRALGEYEAHTGNLTRSIEVYQQLLEKLMAGHPAPDTVLADANDLAQILHALALVQRRAGQEQAAQSLEARQLALWEQWDRKLPRNPFVTRQLREARRSAR